MIVQDLNFDQTVAMQKPKRKAWYKTDFIHVSGYPKKRDWTKPF